MVYAHVVVMKVEFYMYFFVLLARCCFVVLNSVCTSPVTDPKKPYRVARGPLLVPFSIYYHHHNHYHHDHRRHCRRRQL